MKTKALIMKVARETTFGGNRRLYTMHEVNEKGDQLFDGHTMTLGGSAPGMQVDKLYKVTLEETKAGT